MQLKVFTTLCSVISLENKKKQSFYWALWPESHHGNVKFLSSHDALKETFVISDQGHAGKSGSENILILKSNIVMAGCCTLGSNLHILIFSAEENIGSESFFLLDWMLMW